MVERADEYQNKSFLIRTHERTKPRMEAARCLKTEIGLSFTKLWVTHLAKFQKFDNFCRLVGCKIFQTPGTAAVVSELHAHTSAWSGMPDNADVWRWKKMMLDLSWGRQVMVRKIVHFYGRTKLVALSVQHIVILLPRVISMIFIGCWKANPLNKQRQLRWYKLRLYVF